MRLERLIRVSSLWFISITVNPVPQPRSLILEIENQRIQRQTLLNITPQ
jgi:hypothetical protein